MPDPREILRRRTQEQFDIVNKRLTRKDEKHAQRTKADRNLRDWLQGQLDGMTEATCNPTPNGANAPDAEPAT